MSKSKTKTSAPDWSNAIDQFTSYLDAEERSPHTVRNYREDLAAFGSWFRDQYGEDPHVDRLASNDFLEWKQYIEANSGRDGKPAALQTVNRKLAAVRAFLRWAQADERQLALPHIKAPKLRKTQSREQPHWLERPEVRALWAAVEASDGPRDPVIIGLGIHCGLRVSEMAALEWSDVTISERKGELVVRHGKGNKERKIPLNNTVRKLLLDLKADRRDRNDPAVLHGQRGRLTIRGIQEICDRYGRRARVGKKVGLEDFSVHALRHTFGSRLAAKNVPIPEIAQLMGHSDPKTTMGYLTASKENLAKAVGLLDTDDDD